MADVSNRQRQPSGTPQGGEFKNEHKGLDADDLAGVSCGEPETPDIHRLASDLFNYGKGVEKTRVTSGICPDDTIRIDFDDGRIIVGCFDPDYPSCFTFSEYASREALDETVESFTDTYDFETAADPYGATKFICEGLSDHGLESIAASSDPYSRVVSAKDPQTSPETLDRLAQDDNRDVRQAVAANWQKLPEETFNRLASDSDSNIRGMLADRKDAPAPILNKLAQDNNEHVRQAVAENPSTPAETFARLAEDEKPSVRRLTARNPRTPNAVLEHLTRDEDSFVREYARNALKEKN